MFTINAQKPKQSQPIPPPQLQAKRGQKVHGTAWSQSLCFVGLGLIYLQAKQKRIRDRYGDQDDEERELKLAILGVSCHVYDHNVHQLQSDSLLHSTQSSGVPKEQKKGKKGGGKGKKKSFDVVQSSNPKQKYHQQRDKGEKNTPSSQVDKQHKQKAPLLVTVPKTLDSQLLQTQSDLSASDQIQESELGEKVEIVSELGATISDDTEDKETESMDGISTKEGNQSIQKHTERKVAEMFVTADESKLEDNHQLSKSPPDSEHEQETTAQVLLINIHPMCE